MRNIFGAFCALASAFQYFNKVAQREQSTKSKSFGERYERDPHAVRECRKNAPRQTQANAKPTHATLRYIKALKYSLYNNIIGTMDPRKKNMKKKNVFLTGMSGNGKYMTIG